MPLADQVRPQFGELALAELGKTLEQFFAGHQRQHGVAQEFELLVVADSIFALARLLRLLLPRLRAVRDRLLNHRPPPEVITQCFFERRDFPFLHRKRIMRTFGYAALGAASQMDSSPEVTFPYSASLGDPSQPARLYQRRSQAGPW